MASAQSHFYFNNTYLKSKPRSLGAFKEEYVVGMACIRCILRFPDNHLGSRPRAVSATHIGAHCWTGVYISLGWFLCYSFVLRWIRYFSEEGAYEAYLLSYAGSSFTYSICTSNRDTPTLREPEHPEKKTPTRPMPLCPNKAKNTQRRCRRLLFVTEREKDVSTTGLSFTLPHRI